MSRRGVARPREQAVIPSDDTECHGNEEQAEWNRKLEHQNAAFVRAVRKHHPEREDCEPSVHSEGVPTTFSGPVHVGGSSMGWT